MNVDDINFSVGEKQLFCLSRALLKKKLGKSSIVLMDEPAASVDESSFIKMREIIKTTFQEQTLIMVTHRLEILEEDFFDRIFVMENGRLTEKI